jgi:hypothetical protein
MRRLYNHDELSRFDSELSADGRELAGELEKKVRVPVYYYLSKHFGRSDQAERNESAPPAATRRCARSRFIEICNGNQNLPHAIADRQSNFQACSSTLRRLFRGTVVLV